MSSRPPSRSSISGAASFGSLPGARRQSVSSSAIFATLSAQKRRGSISGFQDRRGSFVGSWVNPHQVKDDLAILQEFYTEVKGHYGSLWRAFCTMDLFPNKLISLLELRIFLRDKLRRQNFEEEASAIMRALDVDASGTVDADEFLSMSVILNGTAKRSNSRRPSRTKLPSLAWSNKKSNEDTTEGKGPDSPTSQQVPKWLLEAVEQVNFNRDPEIRKEAAQKVLKSIAEVDQFAAFFAGQFAVSLLKDKSATVRAYAANILAAIPDTQHYTDSLLVAFERDEDIKVKIAAANALQKVGASVASHSAKFFVSALMDGNEALRHASAEMLARLGEAAAKQIRQVASALNDDDPVLRLRAAQALSVIGKAAMPHADDLAQLCLYDPVPGVRNAAAAALGCLGCEILPQIDLLADTLKNPDTPQATRKAAAIALGYLQKTPQPDPLSDASLQDADLIVRFRAAESLGKLDDGGAADAQIATMVYTLINQPVPKGLINPQGNVQRDVLNSYIKSSTPYGAQLQQGKMPENTMESFAWKSTDAESDGNSEPEVQKLEPKSSEELSRAADAVAVIEPNALPYAAVLAGTLGNSSESIHARRAAAEAFAGSTVLAAEHTATLASALADEDRVIKCSAAVALSNLGDDAVEHVDDLKKLTLHSNRAVQRTSVKALLTLNRLSSTSGAKVLPKI